MRDRAAILAARSAALLDEADECAIRAELAEARDGLLLSIEAARLAEEQAEEQATEALVAAESMTAEVAECQRRLEIAKAAGDGDLAVRIESRIVRRSIEEEIGELWPQARAAEEAAKQAVTTAALATQARDQAESELGRLAAAESAPLTHERARETVSWSARALRRWHEVILDPQGFTREHRQAAMRMLWRVLASRWGRDAALDLANRVKAERVMYEPRIEFGPDGVTVLQPGIALTGDGTGQAQRASEAQAARASAAANRAIAGVASFTPQSPCAPRPAGPRCGHVLARLAVNGSNAASQAPAAVDQPLLLHQRGLDMLACHASPQETNAATTLAAAECPRYRLCAGCRLDAPPAACHGTGHCAGSLRTGCARLRSLLLSMSVIPGIQPRDPSEGARRIPELMAAAGRQGLILGRSQTPADWAGAAPWLPKPGPPAME